jgi:asparagine synthase (glutamine-hydrolysing)
MPALLRTCGSLHWREKTFTRLADFMEGLSGDQARNYAEQVKIFNRKEMDSLYTRAMGEQVKSFDPFSFLTGAWEEAKTDDLVDHLLHLDIHSYLPEDLLVKVDITTMANSLEARVPFLDHEFMQFAAALPSRLKLRGTESKFLLKRAFADLLPEGVMNRKKMGFGVPVSRWFRHELKGYMYDVLLDKRTLGRGYFEKTGIERLLDEHVSLRNDHSSKIWALLFLETWFRVFIEREGEGASLHA